MVEGAQEPGIRRSHSSPHVPQTSLQREKRKRNMPASPTTTIGLPKPFPIKESSEGKYTIPRHRDIAHKKPLSLAIPHDPTEQRALIAYFESNDAPCSTRAHARYISRRSTLEFLVLGWLVLSKVLFPPIKKQKNQMEKGEFASPLGCTSSIHASGLHESRYPTCPLGSTRKI